MTQESTTERRDDHDHRRDTVVVIVNTRRKEVSSGRLCFQEIVRLAFPDAAFGPDILYTVTYRAGPREDPSGDLAEGGCVGVKDGMIFNVKQTNRS